MTQRGIRDGRARALQGRPAGFVSRVVADGIDLGVIQVIYFGCLLAIGVVGFLFDQSFKMPTPDPAVTIAVQWCLIVLYLGTGWSSTGRTVGKTTLGLRVTAVDGSQLRPPRAFLRALLCATFYPVLLWIVVSRRNAGLHDKLLRTQVLYDWSSHVIVESPDAEPVPPMRPAPTPHQQSQP